MQRVIHFQHDRVPGVAACSPMRRLVPFVPKPQTTANKDEVTCERCKQTTEFKEAK
jgi:hypothetical protein